MRKVVILIFVIFLSVLLGRIEPSWGQVSELSQLRELLCPEVFYLFQRISSILYGKKADQPTLILTYNVRISQE